MADDALTKLRSVAKALRKAGIGTYRLDEESEILDVGGLEVDEEFWTGIRVEIAHDGLFHAEIELDQEREAADTVEMVFDSLRCTLDPFLDHTTTLSWPTLDEKKESWLVTFSKDVADEAALVEWVKGILQWVV